MSNPANDVKQLSEQAVLAYLQSFRLLDTEYAGTIDSGVYFDKITELGLEPENKQEFDDLLYGTDVDNDPQVTFADYVGTLASIKQDSPDDLAAVFEVFDRDGSTEISRDNLNTVLGVFGLELTEEEADSLFKESDKNKDGTLNLKEFLDTISYADKYVKKNGIPPE